MDTSIRKRVKDLCVMKNISITDLEKNLGMGNGTVCKWETSSPSSEKLIKVADYFNVSVDYLLGRETEYIQTPLEKEVLSAYKALSAENKTLFKALLDRFLQMQK